MPYLIPCLLLWLVIGLCGGEMLIHASLDCMERADCESNYAAVFILFTISGLLALQWLIWQAIDQFLTDLIRR